MKQITTQKTQFEYNDRIVKVYLKRLVRLFSSFNRAMSKLSFDEINSLSGETVGLANKLYQEISALIFEYLTAVTMYYYGYVTEKKSDNGYFYGEIDGFDGKKHEIDFDPASFVDEYLDKYNPVTKYLYFPEIDRKKSRLVESIIAVELPQKTRGMKIAAIGAAILTAQRLIVRQMEQYGDCITLAATEKAYADCGVKKVIWHTQEDLKVCADCDELDKKVFDIDQVPPPQHYNCRCWVSPVFA